MERHRTHTKSKDSVAGTLLLAHPAMNDGNFHRAVILMSVHDKDGAMGVMLNRPADKKLGSLTGDFALGPLATVPVFHGGPVQDRQLILVAWESQPDGFRMHFGIEPDKASECLSEGMTVRAFLGYAGWTGGQLETELDRNTWVVAELPHDLITHEQDETLWRDVLGSQSVEWRLLADEPDDPALN